MIDRQVLQELYGETGVSYKRYSSLARRFKHLYHRTDGHFFSGPGRVEIIGNHTDHNGGLVIASSIAKDIIAIAAPNGKDTIHIKSDGFYELVIPIKRPEDLKSKKGTFALVAGLIDGTRKQGYIAEGFDACLTSDVIRAAGLSSSAAFAMVILAIIDFFFNDGQMTYEDYAKIGQYAENVYWHKASGMLDQMSADTAGHLA